MNAYEAVKALTGYGLRTGLISENDVRWAANGLLDVMKLEPEGSFSAYGGEELPLEEYRQVCDLFEEGVYDAISLERCVSQRTCIGAPAPENVRAEAARVAELVK